MSLTYPTYINSVFPDQIDSFPYMQDVSISALEYVKQYQNYYSTGQLSLAAQILVDHPELNNIIMNAEKFNKIIDSIKCIEEHYKDNIESYIQNLVTYQGDYSSTKKYSKYDVMNYVVNGASQSYMCVSLDCPLGTLPTNKDYFIPMTLRGEKGIGIGLYFAGQWDSTINYMSDSAVTYQNIMYSSLYDNNKSHTPSKDSEYWVVIVDFNQTTTYDNSQSNLTSTLMQDAITEVNTKTENNKTNITSNTNSISTINSSITNINNRISNINNTADKDKNVSYANSAGSANSATSATNATYATSSNYATSSGNSDTVDGFHIMASTTDLVAGSTPLTTNVIYICYE